MLKCVSVCLSVCLCVCVYVSEEEKRESAGKSQNTQKVNHTKHKKVNHSVTVTSEQQLTKHQDKLSKTHTFGAGAWVGG